MTFTLLVRDLACLLFAAVPLALAKPVQHAYDDTLFHFHTEPKIKAPKWEINVYNESAVSSGYFFVGPYETLRLSEQMDDGWIGPAIYGQDGTLVWSGAPMFENSNIEDFRMSNVNGKDMLTLMDQQHYTGVVMDTHFDVQSSPQVSGPGDFNSHEYNFVDNGSKALVAYNKAGHRQREESLEVGYDGKCQIGCNGILEWDVRSWTTTFQWSSCGHIRLEESTADKGDVSELCSGKAKGNWDYVHLNSIDKTHDGDFIVSCRHSDAIYKVSHDNHHNGDIVWRLGGKHSDFKMIDGLNFTRQHDIRFRGYNGTHTIVSMLDNAIGEDEQGVSYPHSRGLFIALDEKNMTAQIIAQYDHPDGVGHFSNRRGNLQVLANGNILMGWAGRSYMSEHLPNGTIVMTARLQPKWLGTYRSYKFDFVGSPSAPPRAAGDASNVDEEGGTKTTMYASWNGATEVAEWNFYKTNPLGGAEIFLGTAQKTSFETNWTWNGYAKYVVVEAVHGNGTVLRRSYAAQSTEPEDRETDAWKDEQEWQNKVTPTWWKILHSPWFIAPASIIIGVSGLAALYSIGRRLYAKWPRSWTLRRLSLKNALGRGRYSVLSGKEKHVEEEGTSMDLGDSQEPLMKKLRRQGSEASLDEEEPFVVGEP